MNGAVYDAMTNVFWKLRYGKVYDAMLATPIDPPTSRSARRRGRSSAACSTRPVRDHDRRARAHPLVVGAARIAGGVRRRLRLRRDGIGTPTFIRSWQDFDTVQLVQLPMFLFSATFYPLSVYPVAIQWFVRVSPLYHAITLIRSFTLGTVGPVEPRERGLPRRARPLRDLASPAPDGRAAAHLEVGDRGFEPRTSALSERRSNQLS